MNAFLSLEFKGCLSDIAEDTFAQDAARISRAITVIEQTGARWRAIRDAPYFFTAFENAIDVWPDHYDESLNSPATFVPAFWYCVTVMEPDSDTYLDETLRLKRLKRCVYAS